MSLRAPGLAVGAAAVLWNAQRPGGEAALQLPSDFSAVAPVAGVGAAGSIVAIHDAAASNVLCAGT